MIEETLKMLQRNWNGAGYWKVVRDTKCVISGMYRFLGWDEEQKLIWVLDANHALSEQ